MKPTRGNNCPWYPSALATTLAITSPGLGHELMTPRHSFTWRRRAPAGVDRIRTTHIQIHGIDGGNIVGYYRYAGGHYQGFIATIPEPATLPLLALGLLLAWRRR